MIVNIPRISEGLALKNVPMFRGPTTVFLTMKLRFVVRGNVMSTTQL